MDQTVQCLGQYLQNYMANLDFDAIFGCLHYFFFQKDVDKFEHKTCYSEGRRCSTALKRQSIKMYVELDLHQTAIYKVTTKVRHEYIQCP